MEIRNRNGSFVMLGKKLNQKKRIKPDLSYEMRLTELSLIKVIRAAFFWGVSIYYSGLECWEGNIPWCLIIETINQNPLLFISLLYIFTLSTSFIFLLFLLFFLFYFYSFFFVIFSFFPFPPHFINTLFLHSFFFLLYLPSFFSMSIFLPSPYLFHLFFFALSTSFFFSFLFCFYFWHFLLWYRLIKHL